MKQLRERLLNTTAYSRLSATDILPQTYHKCSCSGCVYAEA